MSKKKKNNIVLKILGCLFIIFMALFIANASGYYESKIREEVVMTDKGIKEFEEKIQNGEEVNLSSFLDNEKTDYSNIVSNLGDNLTNGLENIVSNGMKVFTDIIKSLF